MSKRRIFTLFLVPVLAFIASGCFHRMAPTSIGGSYKQDGDNMVYTVTPYGSVAIPGKWAAGKYAKASRQQYFYSKDTATMIVSIGACSSHPFAKGGVEGFDFVKRYYETEARYQTQLLEQTPEVLVEDKDKRYMLWKLHADGIDQYFLCGVKDCSCNECTYRSYTIKDRKLTAEKATKLLQDLFLNNQ